MIHCTFSHFFSLSRAYIGNTDSQTQFQWIGKLHPLLYITTVHEICRSNQRRISVFSQHLDGFVQFLEECVIYFFLRIIRNGNLAILTDFRIRNRTIRISHATHGSNLYDLSNGIRNRIIGILRYLFHCAQVTVKCWNDTVTYQEHTRPVICSIKIGYCIGPAGIWIGKITSQRSTQQTISKLCRIDIWWDNRTFQVTHGRTQCIIIRSQITRLIRIGVDIHIIAGTGHKAHNQRSNNQFIYNIFLFHIVWY